MPVTPPPARRPRTPLADVDVTAAARNADRIRDIPGRRPVRPITFDSAL